MSDQKLNIEIVTKQSGDSAKKAADDIGKLDKAAQDAAQAQQKLGQSAAASASKHKVFGDALRNLAGGNIAGAITALEQLGTKFKNMGGILMAGGAAVAVWGSNLKKWIGAANEVKKLDIENSIQNTAGYAQMLAQNFERAATAAGLLSEKEKALQSLADTTRGLTAEIERQNIANERARELALATDDLQREAINIKYDRKLADVDARSGKQSVEADKARLEQEAADLTRQNELLRQGVSNNNKVGARKRMNAEELGNQGDMELSVCKSGVLNRRDRVNNARGYYDKQAGELDAVDGLNQDSRAKLDQIKANEAKIEALKKQVETVIPLKQQLEAAKSTGTDIGIAANVVGLRDSRNAASAAAAKAKAQEEADAQALADAQYQRNTLAGRRSELERSIDPAQAAADAANRSAAEAANQLAGGQAKWAGSRNTTMRDKELGPLQDRANSAAAAAAGAEQTLQRTIKSTEDAVKTIDATLTKLDAQISRLGSRMAATRGDQNT